MSNIGRRKWSKPLRDIPPMNGLMTNDTVPIQKVSTTACVDGDTLLVLLKIFVEMLYDALATIANSVRSSKFIESNFLDTAKE